MEKKPLVVFMGNSLFRDDKIALEVGKRLEKELISMGLDVEIVERSGFAFVDLFAEREHVVVVDSVKTDKFEIGEVFLVEDIQYNTYTPFSPHYVGLTEAIKLLKELELGAPEKICVIGIEVEDPYIVSEELGSKLKERLNEITKKVLNLIHHCVKK